MCGLECSIDPIHNCRYISQLATLQSHFCRRTMMRNRGRNQAPHHILPPRERPELIQELNDNDVLLGWGTQTGGDLICETAWFWAPLTPLWLGHCCSVGLGPCQYIGNRRLHDLGLLLKEEYYNVSKSYKVKKIIGRKMYDEILRRGGWFLQQVSKGMGGRDALYDEVDRKKCKEKWKQLLWEKPSNKEEQTPETSSMMKNNGDDKNVPDILPPHVELPESPPVDVGEVEIIFEGIYFPELTSAQEPLGGEDKRYKQSLWDNSLGKEQQGAETSSLQGVAEEDFVDNHDEYVAGIFATSRWIGFRCWWRWNHLWRHTFFRIFTVSWRSTASHISKSCFPFAASNIREPKSYWYVY